jgi:hypothetical protein
MQRGCNEQGEHCSEVRSKSAKGHICGKYRRQHGSESWFCYTRLAVPLQQICGVRLQDQGRSFKNDHTESVKVWYLHPTH